MPNSFLIKIVELSRQTKISIQVFLDITFILFSFFLSMAIRLNDFLVFIEFQNWLIILFLIPSTIIIFSLCGFYNSVIRFISEKFFISVGIGIFLSSTLLYVGTQILDLFMPRSIPFIYFSFLFVLTISSRLFFKYIFLKLYFGFRKPVAIYGAGETGRRLLNSLGESLEYYPQLFIDDNMKLINKRINGLKVFQLEKAIIEIEKNNINLILLAMPNLTNSKRLKLLNKLDKHNLAVKVVSNNNNFINQKTDANRINNISLNDILERKEIPSKPNLMKKNVFKKTVFVTGCGGSIGSELCKQILNLKPKSLIYLDNSEYALFNIDNTIKSAIKIQNLDVKAFPILGSIQDKNLLRTIFNKYNIQTIYHAAAYKHVPLVEKNIIEGVKNNILSTFYLSEISVLKKVETFVLISSDKAVRPTNYMGATKRVSELICQSFSKNQKNTIFSIVRFGNVIGSSGSVIPLFAKQIEGGGPVTLTHKNITRYFMSIKEAVGLVIQAGAIANNGDLFVLDMGKPKKILDLAKKMIRLYGYKPKIEECPASNKNVSNTIIINITGLRPGEKIYEELLINEKTFNTKHPRIFRAREKSISKIKLSKFLQNLEKYCVNEDLKNIKLLIQEMPIDFKTVSKI